jgi:purine-binding chemotaxis protein CheW
VNARNDRFAERVATLRHDFDSAFAEPARPWEEDLEKFLAIRVGSSPYALRLAQIAGIDVDRRAVAVPGPLPELLGIIGVRGRVVPVYSLAALLGVTSPAAPRWVALTAESDLGLAFEHVEGYRAARAADVLASEAAAGAHCPETLRLGGASFGIINVPSIVRTITGRVASLRPRQEH